MCIHLYIQVHVYHMFINNVDTPEELVVQCYSPITKDLVRNKGGNWESEAHLKINLC